MIDRSHHLEQPLDPQDKKNHRVGSDRVTPISGESIREIHIRLSFSIRQMFFIGGVVVVLAEVGFTIHQLARPHVSAAVNPFSPGIIASAKYPLYYPTQLPAGYTIDLKSVVSPHAGVVVYHMAGPNGAKLYVSEIARPAKFDLGGYYQKFSHLTVTGVSDGSIEAGWVNSDQTEVVSRANNQTWVLANTDAHIPINQLVTMLKSWAVSN